MLAPVAALPQPTKLTTTPLTPMDPVPTPAGDQVIFAHGNDDASNLSRHLFEMNSDGSNLHQITNGPNLEWEAAVSPDGQKIAYVAERDGHSDLHVMNADGTGDVNITHDNAGYWEPQWSPDGKELLCCERNAGDGTDLAVMNPDGSNRKMLLSGGGSLNRLAHWTPDGNRVVFVSNMQEGQDEVYSMQADGSDMKWLTPGLMLMDGPSIAPNGDVAIAAADANGTDDLYILKADGSAPQPLHMGGMPLSPRWSPDGSHLAYLNDGAVADTMEIFECTPDGKNSQPLTDARAFHNYPTFMPDGKSMIFTSDEGGKDEIYSIPLNQ